MPTEPGLSQELSGTTRLTAGLPVTLFDHSENSLLGTLGNGASNYLLDTPMYAPGKLQINHDRRTNHYAFNTSLFTEEPVGVLGNAKRRMFYGPGTENFDIAVVKTAAIEGSKALSVRVEAFNVLNHVQFIGPASVDGQFSDSHFGQVVKAAGPRLVEAVMKFTF